MSDQKFSTVLLVDDNDDTNFFHDLLLKDLDYADRVMQALDGRTAIEMVKGALKPGSATYAEVMPEIIFLDVNMPKVDGWDFLEEFQDLPAGEIQNTMVVMLSANFDEKDHQRAMSYECVQMYMEKPLSPKKLRLIKEEYTNAKRKTPLKNYS